MNKKLPIKTFSTPDDLAKHVGMLWRDLQNKSPKSELFFVASPLSSTPLPLYSWITAHADTFDDWRKFRFILMDEQVEKNGKWHYVPINDSASYELFARKKFLLPLQEKTGIVPSNITLKPDLNDSSTIIETHGNIDLLILAIGAKGHYAQVMPGTPIEVGFHISKLIPELAQIHTQKGSQSYERAMFREYGMSLGHQQVIGARQIIVMVTGEKKKNLVKQLLSYNTFDADFPLSIVYHPDVIVKTQVFLTQDTMQE